MKTIIKALLIGIVLASVFLMSINITSWNTSIISKEDLTRELYILPNSYKGNVSSWNTSIVTDVDDIKNHLIVYKGNISSWRAV